MRNIQRGTQLTHVSEITLTVNAYDSVLARTIYSLLFHEFLNCSSISFVILSTFSTLPTASISAYAITIIPF